MNKGHSRTSIFLMEIIISVLLFSLSTAVCAKLFVNTHLRSERTRELNHAVTETQTIIETIRGTADDSFDEAATILSNMYMTAVISQTSDHLEAHIFYDKDFKPCNAGVQIYTADVRASYEGSFCNMTVDIVTENDMIYSINTMKYIP